MAGWLSPSPPPQSCGKVGADPQETGCQSQGALKGTGWWTSCGGQNVVAQPSERWRGTGQERDTTKSESLYCLLD